MNQVLFFCNILKSNLLNELVLPFSNSTKHIRHIWIVFGCCNLNFRQMKPFFNCFFLFFRIEFLHLEKKLIAYPLIGSKSEKPSRMLFVTASQQTVLALMSFPYTDFSRRSLSLKYHVGFISRFEYRFSLGGQM
jgi:hypothetical protein